MIFFTGSFRGSPPYVFCRKIVLKIFGKFTGKQPWQSFIWVKLQSFRLQIPIGLLWTFCTESPLAAMLLNGLYRKNEVSWKLFCAQQLFKVTSLFSILIVSLRYPIVEVHDCESRFHLNIFQKHFKQNHCSQPSFQCIGFVSIVYVIHFNVQFYVLARTCWKERNFRKVLEGLWLYKEI